jgi:hypothetical protein
MAEPRYLIDTHREFIERDGIPIVESFGIDLLHLEVEPWPRLGEVKGAFALTSGHGDFIDLEPRMVQLAGAMAR